MTEPAIESLVDELEAAAGRLRRGELEPEAAAGLVERCAELAGEVGAELEREGRAARREDADEEASGQERLL